MILTPKEKARELVAKFKSYSYSGRDEDREWRFENAKQCALIAVNAIIEVLYSLKFGNALSEEIEYWEAVKQEIIKSEL